MAMNRMFVAGAATALTLSAVAWGAVEYVQTAKAAPDKSLGMATMSAVVDYEGTLIRGSGVVSSVLFGNGAYRVTFDRPLLDCVISLTAASIGPGSGSTHVYLVGLYLNDAPNTLQIGTYAQSTGQANNASFHMLAFCGK